MCARAEGGRKGQASEGPELGFIYFIHSVETQSVCVCVCVCVCVQKEAGKDRHLKGRSLGSHTSHIE